ncbi:amino acid/amide ABC transporter membrane protein 2, HAAT family /amino acid/amide ABC transporter ATP-binding protein 1, HAAT family [Actinacidiphila yanglinensis]|uniref:Amino acid/amide ABC transporter membrane protein 2, HAAT family /amino acid/amide ABC transporter ATP-binding protein 1, HAAT family n=1 Tax=Actinacidiphila yanglinensis TaxID=310779 RepID=A0A1H6C562_9ACTN|nr:branched-chain amino acid ABC transporter ATP-binding protein/permease [Actinacidiphila yanglinensis]SEG67775.1 amino acid/amide ABC transporter membrane protein 2, HAAT family /amino acid/amide ABC transporter ATP-binding protein 1, HAAT family [Actinacidiphila yanglinensis]
MLTRARDDVGWPALVLLLLLALAPLAVTGVSEQGILVVAMIYAVGAVGLDVLTGYSGQFSFGQFVYFAIGAYVMAAVRIHAHWPWVPAIIAGVVAAALVAAVIGSLFVRLRFFGSAVGTFFLGAVAVDLISGARLSHWTGGSNGLAVLPVTIGANSLSEGDWLYYTVWIALAVSVALCLRYTKVRAGMAARVVKENEVVAAVLGVRVFREKVRAQALAGAVAGLGGCMLALDVGYLSPDTFGISQSIELFAIVAVGGTGSIVGPVLGAVFFFSLVNGFASTSASASQLLFSLVVLAVVVLFNRGLYDLVEQAVRKLFALRRAPAATGAPEGPKTARAGDAPVAPDEQPVPAATAEDRPRQAPAGPPLLVLESIGVDFGGVRALGGVDLSVARGEVHAVIGPNGAGKTTLLNCISGIQPATGRVVLDGDDVTALPVSVRRGRGISRTFQHPSLVADLTARQNVEVGAYATHNGSALLEMAGLPGTRRRDRVARERAVAALELLDFPASRWGVHAGELTMGEQKHIDIARALANEPKLLLLDEPTAGLGEEEIDAVAGAIEGVRRAGVTVVVIAHHVGFVRRIADRCTVLDFGRVLTSGTAGDVLSDDQVVDVFVGAGGKS